MTEMDSNCSCLELALEGERLCKLGDCKAGVTFLEAALQTDTSDKQMLSAIYSQLGNAYFYIGDYAKAITYHQKDINLARCLNDEIGEAKANGNLGNAFKVLGQFDDAILCCRRHMDIAKRLNDKIGEGRALYNLGNVYHAKGKHLGKSGQQDLSKFPEEVKKCLQQAVDYYMSNLSLMVELGDRFAQGRVCGNLGNTHYLLGNFTQAVSFHTERLKIAKEFGDVAAERRACSNLGNAYIFLGNFEMAAVVYKQALDLAKTLGNRAVEAQAFYSLGNTHVLLHNYSAAIECHMKHLDIAEELTDKIGEARACWSLCNAYSAVGNYENAIHFATKHMTITSEIGDEAGQATARMNLVDFKRIVELCPPQNKYGKSSRNFGNDNLDLQKSDKDWENNDTSLDSNAITTDSDSNHLLLRNELTNQHRDSVSDEDRFLELLSQFQSKRMDDQRCSISVLENKENLCSNNGSSTTSLNNLTVDDGPSDIKSVALASNDDGATGTADELLDLIAGIQGKRLNEQRASLPMAKESTQPTTDKFASTDGESLTDDNFFDLLMRCQASRLEDQRSALPTKQQSSVTVPDDDFFSLILRLQSERIDDQRSGFRPFSKKLNRATEKTTNNPSTSRNPLGKLKIAFKPGRGAQKKC